MKTVFTIIVSLTFCVSDGSVSGSFDSCSALTSSSNKRKKLKNTGDTENSGNTRGTEKRKRKKRKTISFKEGNKTLIDKLVEENKDSINYLFNVGSIVFILVFQKALSQFLIVYYY